MRCWETWWRAHSCSTSLGMTLKLFHFLKLQRREDYRISYRQAESNVKLKRELWWLTPTSEIIALSQTGYQFSSLISITGFRSLCFWPLPLSLYDSRATVFVENQRLMCFSGGDKAKTTIAFTFTCRFCTQCWVQQRTNRPRSERAAIETFTSPALKNANRAEWSSYLTKE